MKICEICEKSVETLYLSDYGDRACKQCVNYNRFAVMRDEGEFAL